MNHYEWLIKSTLAYLKESQIRVQLDSDLYVKSVTRDDTDLIKYIARWRSDHQDAFPTQFKVTYFGTAKWFREKLMNREDRVMFWIYTRNEPVGHIGLSEFNFEDKSCEIDNVIRGASAYPGAMGRVLDWLCCYAQNELRVENVLLRVFHDNEHALKFYKKHGFRSIKNIALKKIETPKLVSYVETTGPADRCFVLMKWMPK